MTAVLILATLLAAGYFSGAMATSVPESLSATYYSLGRYGWVFQVFMAVVASLLFLVWSDVSSEGCEWMAFVACASLGFVACAPAFRLPLEGAVHYGSAIVCCVCAVWWQIAEGLWDVTLWFAAVGGMLSLVWRRQWCWWMECAVIGSLLANLWRCG